MSGLFYAILTAVSDIFGAWLFALTARGIAAGYFFLSPRRAATSARFYRVLFADRNRLYGWWCAWRQFQNFTTVFLDRYLLRDSGAITFTFQGREHFIQAMEKGHGGILLMSHMGNWEVGARLLRRMLPQLPLMLFMGRRDKEQIERLQKEDLTASGIRILVADQDADAPFALVEGASFLQTGGFVSMAGDMVWRPDQRVVAVRFLGCTVRLPEAPFMLAMLSGVPLYVFFASSRGRGQHHFSVSGPVAIAAEHRAQRRQAVARAAQAYADLLEDQVRCNPLEWYHFEPFLGPAAGPERSSPESEQTREGRHVESHQENQKARMPNAQ
ncbi:MAG: lauroyl acyltransferase [Syntrophobacteraceae bacterium]|jgi:predicted LPLAT superfamily acyltransferase